MQWKKLKEEEFSAGYRPMITRTFELPDGRVVDFTIKNDGKPVCVLALTKENNVILVKQYRPGPQKVLLELPGGDMEAGETFIGAMERELLEETGYKGELRHVGTSYECAYSTRHRQSFVATNCVKVQEPDGDANEFGVVVEMPLNDFRKHLTSGELTDSGTGYKGLEALGLLIAGEEHIIFEKAKQA